jgi:hypothetical protein
MGHAIAQNTHSISRSAKLLRAGTHVNSPNNYTQTTSESSLAFSCDYIVVDWDILSISHLIPLKKMPAKLGDQLADENEHSNSEAISVIETG